MSGTISICPQTTSACNAVGSGELATIDFGLVSSLFDSTLTCGSSVNNLQRFVRSCRFVEWIGVVCMMYTMCIHITFTYSQERAFGCCTAVQQEIHFFDVAFVVWRMSFACSLEADSISARWVTDMGLIKYFDVWSILFLGTVQES